jgi:hypothetical protein
MKEVQSSNQSSIVRQFLASISRCVNAPGAGAGFFRKINNQARSSAKPGKATMGDSEGLSACRNSTLPGIAENHGYETDTKD